MEWDLVAFLAFSAVEVVAAYMVIASKKLVQSVFWLAVTLITIGAIYIVLGSEFLGLVQILVYAGAVPVLFLFGIMLTRRRIMEEPHEAD